MLAHGLKMLVKEKGPWHFVPLVNYRTPTTVREIRAWLRGGRPRQEQSWANGRRILALRSQYSRAMAGDHGLLACGNNTHVDPAVLGVDAFAP